MDIKKHKKKEYWGKEEEEAVATYLRLDPESDEADRIFETKIYSPLKKLVENIMFTYHLTIQELPIDEQVMDAMSFVLTKFNKYDLDRGPKSFSYYGTIIKHYLIMKKNKHYNKKINFLDIESVIGFEYDEQLYEDNDAIKEINSNEYLFTIVANKIDTVLSTNLNIDKNVYKVGEIVSYLLKNYQFLNINNKRQFYFIAKEYTELSSKEITKALKKIKELYKDCV